MKKYFSPFLVFVFGFIFTAFALASTLPPALGELPTGEVKIDALLAKTLVLIQSYGGLSWMAKIAGAIYFIVALTKVSFLRPYLWEPFETKLGNYKWLFAPLLALIYGIFNVDQFSWSALLAFVGTGLGATIISSVVDGFKTMPGVGSFMIIFLEVIQKILGGPDRVDVGVKKTVQAPIKA